MLRTSEFLPYVVFIEAPDFEVLKAMNRSAIESGVVTKQLTVSVPTLLHILKVKVFCLSLMLILILMWRWRTFLALIPDDQDI